MPWNDPDDDFGDEDGPLILVFAEDILSPFKLVGANCLHSREHLITNDDPWEHGVIIHEGEEVTQETLSILHAAGVENMSFKTELVRRILEE